MSSDNIQIKACRIVFMSPAIGTRSLQGHIDNLGQTDRLTPELHDLQQIVSLEDEAYNKFTSEGNSDLVGDSLCRHIESLVRSEDILNLQFTSGRYTNLHYLIMIGLLYFYGPDRNYWLPQSCHVVSYVSKTKTHPAIKPTTDKHKQKPDQQCPIRGRSNATNAG